MNPAMTNEQIVAYYVSLLIQQYCGQTSPQIITFSQVPASGRFTLTYDTLTIGGNGQTGGLPWNATNGQLTYAFENEVFSISSDPNNPDTYSNSTQYNPAFDPMALGVWEADFNVTTGSTFSWTDKTSRAITASQSSSTHEPTLLSNQLNGLPVIHMNPSTNKYLTLPIPILKSKTTPFSVYVVVRPSSGSLSSFNNIFALSFTDLTNDTLLLGYCSNAGAGYGGGPYWGGDTPNYGSANYQPNISNGTFVFDTTDFQVWALTYNGGGLNNASSFSFVQSGVNLGCKRGIGALSATSNNEFGSEVVAGPPGLDLYGVYAFDDILSGSQLAGFQSYILNKLGLTT